MAPVPEACADWVTPFHLQIEDETQVSRATQGEQDHYEMHVRAANIVSPGMEWRSGGDGAVRHHSQFETSLGSPS